MNAVVRFTPFAICLALALSGGCAKSEVEEPGEGAAEDKATNATSRSSRPAKKKARARKPRTSKKPKTPQSKKRERPARVGRTPPPSSPTAKTPPPRAPARPSQPPATERSAPPAPSAEAGLRWTRAPLNGWRLGVHVLALAWRGDELWVGTFGEGLWVRERGRWRNVRASGTGLESDFIGSLASDGKSVWVGSIAHGFGRLDRRGGWSWQGRKQMGKRFLFPTMIATAGAKVFVATTDGLRVGESGRWATASPGARYLLSVAPVKPDDPAELWVGHLHGLAKLSGTRRAFWRGSAPPRPVRAILTTPGGKLVVASDNGAAISGNGGRSWKTVGVKDGLPSAVTTSLAADGKRVWVGTAAGLAELDPKAGRVVGAHRNGDRPRPNQVNALLANPGGGVWVGTSDGLWRVEPATVAPRRPKAPCTVDASPRPFAGLNFARPVSSQHNTGIDQTYHYGSTWAGRFQLHHGVEFNDPEGTPLLAIGAGTVTFAGEVKHKTKAVVVRQDARFGGEVVYSVYLHLAQIQAKAGQRVKTGDTLGTCGHTGRATNDHLHFEIRLTAEVGDGIGQPAYNPAAFLKPLAGTGVIAGVVRRGEARVPGARVVGPIVAVPAESPFAWAETYALLANPNPELDENFVVADVPAGVYPLAVEVDGKVVRRCARVEAGRLTFVDLALD